MMENTMKTSRRQLLKSATGAVAAFTIVPRHVLGGQGATAPSAKLAVASIGAGGRAGDDIQQVARDEGTQIVALCDVDLRPRQRGGSMIPKFPNAKVYQ